MMIIAIIFCTEIAINWGPNPIFGQTNPTIITYIGEVRNQKMALANLSSMDLSVKCCRKSWFVESPNFLWGSTQFP
jgi:hypothetical protein